MAKSIEELRAARAARHEAATSAAEAHERLCLELEDQFCAAHGPRGVAWDMANEEANAGGVGPICVAKERDAAMALSRWKAWQNKPGAAYEDVIAFVRPAVVYPELAKFDAIALQCPEIVYAVVAILSGLYGAGFKLFAGKR